MIDETRLINMIEEKLPPCTQIESCKDCKYSDECLEGEKSYKVLLDLLNDIFKDLAEEYKNSIVISIGQEINPYLLADTLLRYLPAKSFLSLLQYLSYAKEHGDLPELDIYGNENTKDYI